MSERVAFGSFHQEGEQNIDRLYEACKKSLYTITKQSLSTQQRFLRTPLLPLQAHAFIKQSPSALHDSPGSLPRALSLKIWENFTDLLLMDHGKTFQSPDDLKLWKSMEKWFTQWIPVPTI